MKIPKKALAYASIFPIMVIFNTYVSSLYIIQFDSFPMDFFKHIWMGITVLYIVLTFAYRELRKRLIPTTAIYLLTIIFLPLVITGLSCLIIEPAMYIANANIGKQEPIIIQGVLQSKWEQKSQSKGGHTRYYISIKNALDSKSVSLRVPIEIYNESVEGKELRVDLAKGYFGATYLRS